MQRNPHEVVAIFEQEVARYCGAPYAVAVNSCTSALLLSVAYWLRGDPVALERGGYSSEVEIPKHTYCSVPQSIIHAGGRPTYREENWTGMYQLRPLPVWDCARRFTSGMFINGQMMAVSFHISKILGIEQGGAILHDNAHADAWLRRARFDGRTTGVHPMDEKFDVIGWHCYINPSTAAQGLLRLYSLPQHNADLPPDPYPDLSRFKVFT